MLIESRSTTEQEAIIRLIDRYQEIFSNQPGNAKLEGHKITLTTTTPIVTHPYK